MENQEEKQQTQNVSEISTHYTKEQRRKYNAIQKKIIYRRRRLTVVFGVTIIMAAFLGVNIFKNINQINQLEKALAESVVERDSLKDEEENLAQDVSLLKDEEYLAKLARRKFYYSREGETVYHIPSLEEKTNEENNTSDK